VICLRFDLVIRIMVGGSPIGDDDGGEPVCVWCVSVEATKTLKESKTDIVVRVREAWHSVSGYSASLLDRWQPPERVVLVLTALIVGVGAGVGAVVFRWLIQSIREFSFTGAPSALGLEGRYYVVLIPAIGGLVVGPLTYFFAREAKGHGVPEVMEAVALRGGRIRPIVGLIKALASSICIGTGGSVGREGPIVQIGSAWGSTVGQWLHFSDERVRNLVACGAAGGIAATFNAPVAGVIFALEVILQEFSAGYFSTVVISSVTASVISRMALGDVPAFPVPDYSLISVWELPLYAVLGVVAAFVAAAFIFLLYKAEDVFDGWRFPEYLKPAVGGLGVGVIGLFLPQILGVGYEEIESTLLNPGDLTLLAALLVAKLVVTSVTLGSGGSGGVFAPALFMGAMVGGAYGQGVHQIFPHITASAGAYALVGMAAVFAGAARAPITAILILFEMSDDYLIILPLMLSTVVCTLLAEHLSPESIYTVKLVRRGVRLALGRDIDVMQGVFVKEAMTPLSDLDAVHSDMSVEELAQRFDDTRHHGFPVLDEKGELCGVVTLRDLEEALHRGDIGPMTVADIATTTPVTAYPDEPLWVALKRLGVRDVGRLPVIDRENPRKLLGVLRRRDVIRAYNLGIMRRLDAQQRAERLRLGRLGGTRFVEMMIGEESPVVGRKLLDVDLPQECTVVSLQRGREVIIPHGDTVITAGDKVIAFADDECAAELRAAFEGPPEGRDSSE
jgi:CIC family chloride channel protein